MNKAKFFLGIAVLMGLGFISFVLLNIYFIFVLKEPNVFLLNATPSILLVLLSIWFIVFIGMSFSEGRGEMKNG